MELGNSSIKSPTIMYNILGPKTFQGEYNVLIKKQDNIHLKMYGKLESKPQRKIGHVNIVDKENREFARGLSSFSSVEISKIMGRQSNEIESLLGYISKSEVVHKDDMVEV